MTQNNWSAFVWSYNAPPDHGNLDQIYPPLCPHSACPECGSVWTQVLAYGCLPQYPLRAEVECLELGRSLSMWMRTEGFSRPAAVRLLCASGHRIEYNGREMRVSQLPFVVLAGIVAAGALVINSLYGKMGKPYG